MASAIGSAADDPDAGFFSNQVAPVLESRCAKCHSHAAGKMKGGLTLDSASGWREGGDSGPAVMPGNPDASLLISAVRHDDPDLQMPPRQKLPADEIAILVTWVKRGAPGPRVPRRSPAAEPEWWSLRRMVAPKPPGDGHPIDAFIRQRLKTDGIVPVRQAERTTLARRLYVNLHGFQPTPAEVARFAADQDPKSFERLVDELLSSPRYGERWARHWLDSVHFADSHGCEHDVKRPHAWRFRDYVIERFNADVPWARFIREQLAADFFFPDEPRLTPALGFIAAGPLELSRAGTAPVTFDYLDRDDMVTQTMAAFASTTANCARCHTHKFDPITQEDYYALQAVFAGVGKGDVMFDTNAEVQRRRRELNRLLIAATNADPDVLLAEKHASRIRIWEAARNKRPVNWRPLNPEVFMASGGATLTKQSDASILATGETADAEIYTITAPVTAMNLTAVRLDVLKDERLPMNGPGRAANGNLHLAEVDLQYFPGTSNAPIKLKITRASADFDQTGWTAAHAIDGDKKTGWAIFPRTNESHHIVFELGRPITVQPGGRLAVSLKQLHPPKHLIGRFRLSATDAADGAARVFPAGVRSGLRKPPSERTKAERVAIAAVALREQAGTALAGLPAKSVTYAVSSDWSRAKKLTKARSPKTVNLLRRGDIHQPVREVGPGALSALGHLPARFDLSDTANESARRAALADWLAHPDNPFTWRSIVNRVWHYHFGRGLCDTPNDFGRMGSQPTHPELLDWLATWFRDQAKGSLKKLHRLILTSRTWRQASGDASHANGPDNLLLWRMNRRRMDAETFRDSTLRVAGRLDLAMGGPGIEQFRKSKGPQATPSLDYASFDWNSEAAGRRSIYRVVWRGIADPFMEALDFPDLGLLAPKRGFSVSALQSLVLFNNEFVLRASEWIAQRVMKESPDLEGQISRAVELILLRTPNPEERSEFAEHVRVHGLPALCRVLLNSNEFLFVE